MPTTKTPPTAHVGFNTPFQEQIDYLLNKLRVPTERWDDIQRSAHDRAFMVAGAAKADLLKDLHDAVLQRAADGKGLKEFQKDFKAIVAKHGWTGWTGEGSKEGVAWRTKVIYQTNMAQSYAAGRYRQMTDPEYLRLRPYWRYIHREGVRNPRPHHLAWHGLTLKADHPFWQSHYPPNGWGCGCRIAPIGKAEGERSAGAGLGDPPDGWDKINPATDAPTGIDKGFDYAAGAGVKRPLQELVDAKLLKLPPELADALKADLEQMAAMASAGNPAIAVSTPKFVEAKTAKAAAQWAMDNNLADFADYTGIKPEVANAWNQSLLEHLQEFPALRDSQKFIGTGQAQFARWREIEIQRDIARLQATNPHVPNHDWRPTSEKRVKAKKVGDQYAHAWSQPDVSGIAVNKKWGASPDVFEKSIARDVVQGHFQPHGATFKSVADHEMGHMLDYALSLKVDSEVIQAYKQAQLKGIKNEVSGYAGTNIQEFIAECWAEARNSPAPRPFAKKIADIARSRYFAKHP